MKRLIRKSDLVDYKVGDNVMWEHHPYDTSVYTITQILTDGTLMIDNGISAYTNIKPSVLKPA